MLTASWNIVYEKPPLQRDVTMVLLALLLHLPLFTIHLKAPEKQTIQRQGRLHNIDFIEQQIERRRAEPVKLPPPPPQTVKKIAEKAEELKKQILPERKIIAPPKPPARDASLIAPAKTDVITPKAMPRPLAAPQNTLSGRSGFKKELAMASPSTSRLIAPGSTGGAALNYKSNQIRFDSSGQAALAGKSGFQVSKGAMPVGIGDDASMLLPAGSPQQIVSLPVGNKTGSDRSVLSPVVKMDKGAFTQGEVAQLRKGNGGSMASDEGGLMGAGTAGGAIAFGDVSSASVPQAALPLAKTGRTLSKTPLPSGGTGTGFSQGSSPRSTAASVTSLPAIPARRQTAEKRSMFTITGPLKDRQVISRVIPAYPESARQRGIEATVVLQFTVSSEGVVKNNMRVLRTSGYPDMDQEALRAIKQWKFVPLSSGEPRDETGTITFHYSIR